MVTLKCALEVTHSIKVIGDGTMRKLGRGFLFTFHSNCGPKPFRRYSASNNGVTLKSGFGVVEGH